MNFVEFDAVGKELIKQYKSLEPPVKEAVDTLLLAINTSTDNEIDAIITTIFSAFYHRYWINKNQPENNKIQ